MKSKVTVVRCVCVYGAIQNDYVTAYAYYNSVVFQVGPENNDATTRVM